MTKVTKDNLPDGVIARIGDIPPRNHEQSVSNCVRLMHQVAVSLTHQQHSDQPHPIALATVVLNADGSVSTAWSELEPDDLYRLMWGLDGLRERLGRVIDSHKQMPPNTTTPAQQDDIPPPPPQ